MNDGRSASSRRRRDRRSQRIEVLGVLDALHVPAVGREALEVVLAVEGDRRCAVDRDVVVVVADDQLAEPEWPAIEAASWLIPSMMSPSEQIA